MLNRPWCQSDLNRFIEEYPVTPVAVLCRLYGRSERAIASKAHKLGLRQHPALKSALGRLSQPKRKSRGEYRRWSKADRDAAMALYPKVSTAAIAAQFGRSVRSVRYLAYRLGTKKLKKGLTP